MVLGKVWVIMPYLKKFSAPPPHTHTKKGGEGVGVSVSLQHFSLEVLFML